MYRIGEQEIEAVARVIRSGNLFRYLDGASETASFEKELARKTGTEFAIAMTNGTSALVCALVGMGIGPGDEVLVPAYTFMASAVAVLATGAIPVVAEIDESLGIDPADVDAKIGPRTRAIMPVHMLGLPCNMDGIMEVAKRRNVLVCEDSCQADGGSYKGRRLGSIGSAGAFSYNYYKIMTAGEGGAVVTSDRTIFERALIQHDGGAIFRPGAGKITSEFYAGWNVRMNEIQAAILRVQLKRVDSMLNAMRKRKQLFVERLSDHPRFKLSPCNDLQGDCGSHVGFHFETPEAARDFVRKFGGYRPIDSSRHIYTDWGPVMDKHGAHHPARDPFKLRENAECRTDYSPDMCKRSLDILARTVVLALHPDTPMRQVEKQIEKIASEA